MTELQFCFPRDNCGDVVRFLHILLTECLLRSSRGQNNAELIGGIY